MLELVQMIASLVVSIMGLVHNGNETNDEAFFAELKVRQECVQPLTRDDKDVLHSAGDPICEEQENLNVEEKVIDTNEEIREVEGNAQDS